MGDPRSPSCNVEFLFVRLHTLETPPPCRRANIAQMGCGGRARVGMEATFQEARMGCGAGSSRSGANIARMGYGAVSTWSAWYRWASCPDARTMLMVLCIRLVFASACTHRARQTHSAGWLKLLVPTCPVQFGTKSFQPFLNHVICVSVHVQLELSSSQIPHPALRLPCVCTTRCTRRA